MERNPPSEALGGSLLKAEYYRPVDGVDWGAEKLFQVIVNRYDNHKRTILTSNMNLRQLTEHLGIRECRRASASLPTFSTCPLCPTCGFHEVGTSCPASRRTVGRRELVAREPANTRDTAPIEKSRATVRAYVTDFSSKRYAHIREFVEPRDNPGAALVATKAGICVEIEDLDELRACVEALATAAASGGPTRVPRRQAA